ncbi:MoxR family ATPase [Pannus brasiliensis CCIBt3594]|uniref:MoxR family ATPase n=1 Tax=Pannus brasiliensis CCIBt3594 TaxID=1427578 RepID=A0AAW9QSF8_9CHRO
MATKLKYTGKIQPDLEDEYPPIRRKIYPYSADEDLIEAVNLAIDLRMPLLLEGEPGCGKSRLAHALVYELNHVNGTLEKPYPIEYGFYSVQSVSKATDSLYLYDYIGRLQAAQIGQAMQASGQNIETKMKDPANPENWVDYRPLGNAFKNSQQDGIQSVVLIDEIDKADRDFPNDLLQIIEDRAFTIQETGVEIKAREDASPIIIITSNREKSLPPAFLRRCLYHYIPFPDEEKLKEILSLRFKDRSKEIIDTAIDRFLEVRSAQEDEKAEGEKKVSASELIAWFQSLLRYPEDELLEKLGADKLPHASVLLKSRDDLDHYSER